MAVGNHVVVSADALGRRISGVAKIGVRLDAPPSTKIRDKVIFDWNGKYHEEGVIQWERKGTQILDQRQLVY